MITFNSQEEFENAVMEVLKERLHMEVSLYDGRTAVSLLDSDNYSVVCAGSDSDEAYN